VISLLKHLQPITLGLKIPNCPRIPSGMRGQSDRLKIIERHWLWQDSSQWPTNRKSYTRFRLAPKWSTLDDPKRPWTAKTHSVAEKMRLLEPTAQIW